MREDKKKNKQAEKTEEQIRIELGEIIHKVMSKRGPDFQWRMDRVKARKIAENSLSHEKNLTSS